MAKRPYKIRPYARLLTMLGDQLIKNERIALIELIKNAYDADASWVNVSFENFGDNYETLEDSQVVIEDDGHGMDESIILNHWLNPATPEKKNRKKQNPVTLKGRVIQGEKGIGRFSILKLGKKIDITTRPKDSSEEHIIEYDFTSYDDEFTLKGEKEGGERKELFLDDLEVLVSKRTAKTIIVKQIKIGSKRKNREPFGTKIEITSLKGKWSKSRVENVYRDLSRLQSIFSDQSKNDFEVTIFKNGERQNFQEKYYEQLKHITQDCSVLKVENGYFDDKELRFTFDLGGVKNEFLLKDPRVSGLSTFNKRFGKGGCNLEKRPIECGPFKFGFYVFDFSPKAQGRFLLDKAQKDMLKDHRIYLYRDGIRVYPYGEPDDDWLNIDVFRGTISAGQFLSNDQVVGFINISQKDNPSLRDKTNREGLIEQGEATQDFIVLIQSILHYLRHVPYKMYQIGLEKKVNQASVISNQIQQDLSELSEELSDNKPAQRMVKNIAKRQSVEREYLVRRAETTEELAGVGLSVETASHDIMAIMSRTLANLDSLISDLSSPDNVDWDDVVKELQSIRGGMGFVESQLKDIQLLFTSSKQRRKKIKIRESVEKVEKIYRRLLNKQNIELEVIEIGLPLVAKLTDAVILQLLLNLFDNAVYWLGETAEEHKKIKLTLDGTKGQLVFSDNGPGIDQDYLPYIFEPFFSGKGEEGRGLGLYIARQLLERSECAIEYGKVKSEKALSGANFIVSFYSN